MLNDAQRETMLQIAASVHARKFQPFLLHGVTGSGKTAVYIAAMRRALDAGLSSLLLVPEIGLTPAMLAQLRFTFGDQVALLHSALSGAERTAQWHRIRRGEAHVVVGTRSAVFAPIADLALIVIDEEHDTSYKQAELPRYHARDVAVMRAKLAGATVVLVPLRHRSNRGPTRSEENIRFSRSSSASAIAHCRKFLSSTCARNLPRPARKHCSRAP